MSADQLGRWLKLIMLVQLQPGIRLAQLAERVEVSERTVYRDMERVSGIVPISQEGHGKGYSYIGRFRLSPPELTEEELRALSLLPGLIDSDKMPSGFQSAYDKILASQSQGKLNIHSVTEQIAGLMRMGKPTYQKKSLNFLSPIMQAIMESRTILTDYHTQWRNTKEYDRKIDPYYLVPREQRFYLIGFCHKNNRVKVFRLSRFQKVNLTDDIFDKTDFDVAKAFKHTWSIYMGDGSLTKYRIQFSAKVANYVREEELFVKPLMEDLPDGGLIFEVTVNEREEFLRWLMTYGEEAKILKPLAERDRMKERLRVWRNRYE